MSSLDIVEAQRPTERVEHGLRDGVVAALLHTSQVVGADSCEHGDLLAAEPRDTTPARTRYQADLGRSEAVSA